MVFVIFIVSRIAFFIAAFTAQKTVPYLGFFPYKELLVEYNLPTWISALANFDGIHYLLIAKQGYSQWEQAFFPLYPLLIKIISFIIPNCLAAALLISHTSFAIGLIYFNKLLRVWGIKTSWPLLFLLSFPTSFFFGVVYTEGLFFMLFILSLYFLYKKQYWLAGICAALSSLTRLIGIFLIVPFFFHLITEKQIDFKNLKFKINPFDKLRINTEQSRSIKNYIFLLLSPLLGLFSYMSYLWITTGDPLFFFNSQPLFGANRSTHLILLPQVYYRYLKILFIANHNFQWYLSLFEMSVFSFVLIILVLDLMKISQQIFKPSANLRGLQWPITTTYFLLGLNIFSFINLVLPTLTGTFSSIPRYALFSLSFFLYLAQLRSKKIKVGLVVVFVTLQIVLLSLFIQGYFVG